MYMCLHRSVHLCGSEEGIRSSGVGFIGGFELPVWMLGTELGPLWKSSTYLDS